MEDGKGYTADMRELVKREVSSHMKPFVEVTMKEHQDTRDEVRELKHLVCQTKFTTNDAVQYGLIAVLFLLMFVLPTCV